MTAAIPPRIASGYWSGQTDRTDLYDQIGRGGLNVRDSDAARTAVSAPASQAEQEEKVERQLRDV